MTDILTRARQWDAREASDLDTNSLIADLAEQLQQSRAANSVERAAWVEAVALLREEEDGGPYEVGEIRTLVEATIEQFADADARATDLGMRISDMADEICGQQVPGQTTDELLTRIEQRWFRMHTRLEAAERVAKAFAHYVATFEPTKDPVTRASLAVPAEWVAIMDALSAYDATKQQETP